ncbi:MAG: TIGR03960 family B12-binding radical SAM protein [Endomicrobium sp.]|jgi:radical SAM family uncharacterized protein/radical SAM-linked protein|nr:TIGR03960 family B12-binding radical SAM protein [Endomicrobium sp.]
MKLETKQININDILKSIQKPARYINGEINSYHHNKHCNDVSIVLCFPDLYEIGASNLGIEILYHLVNEKKLAICERVFAPGEDMEIILRNNNIPLFSLESKICLKNFNIIGFTIQCELAITNILNILNLSHINVFSKDRSDHDPLIIAGGPALTNPEPFCDFFDLFVLGDGEDTIVDILTIYKHFQHCELSKIEKLQLLSEIQGVYIPSFYHVTYNHNNTNITSVKTILKNIKPIVTKRITNLNSSYFPKKKILPFMDIVHNRMTIEIARGCLGRCRFCQASKYYYPWRQRDLNNVLRIIQDNMPMGFEEMTFASLSCSDYQYFEDLLIQTKQIFADPYYSISLPSLRCNAKTTKLLKYISQNYIKKPALTLAPEAGTERLRNVIGKYISDNQIIETILTAYSMGWKVIKLYFMIGLPTETDDDIINISYLLKIIKKQAKSINLNVTISPFIPKAQTPFQWVAMNTMKELSRKIALINKLLLPITKTVRIHNYEASFFEALIARGNRKLSKIIYEVWQKGAKFDQWVDKCKINIWKETLIQHGIKLDDYIHATKNYSEILPWDHLFFGISKKTLFNDYQQGINEVIKLTTNNSYTLSESAINKNKHHYLIIKNNNYQHKYQSTITRLQLCFSKRGMIKFISHLDQVNLLRRLTKIAGLPIALTSGFNPKVKSSYGPPLPVGYESYSEYMDLYLTQKVNLGIVKKQVSNVLPSDMKLIKLKVVPKTFPSLNTLINITEYEIHDTKQVISQNKISKFLDRNEIIINQKRKNGQNITVNIKTIIRCLQRDNDIVRLQIRIHNGAFIRPEIILNLLGYNALLFSITRSNLFIETRSGNLYTI